MRYYAEQFGAFWSLDRAEMEEFLKGGIETGGHDLTPCKQLFSRPRGILRERGESDFYTLDPTVFLISPLDFDEDAYAYELNRLREDFPER